MAPSKVLFYFLLSFLLVVILVNKVESQNTSFAINAFTPHSQLLTYERDAFVPPDSSFVRMTALNNSRLPRTNSVGRVLYRAPVNFWSTGRQASFETTITLQMNAAGRYDPATLGHGITFFVVPVNSTRSTGGSGENLGIYDAVAPGSPIFAVEFDVDNSGIFSPKFPHIGINVNSIISQNLTRANLFGQRITARITYDALTKQINVVATYGISTSTVSFFFNLKAILPQQVQVGLSASTGDPRIAFLYVYTWHFNSIMVPDLIGNTHIKQYGMYPKYV